MQEQGRYTCVHAACIQRIVTFLISGKVAGNMIVSHINVKTSPSSVEKTGVSFVLLLLSMKILWRVS